MTRRVALASLSIAAAFSCAAVAIAEASSSTTRIDAATCHPEKGGGNIGTRSCAGLGGWAVHTARNGDKSGVIFGVDGGLQPLQFLAAPGWAPKVLWRFDGREPVAAAHRIHTSDGTVTIVTRLAEPKACHSAYIDADLRNSEWQVEQALDRAETFRCGIDQPEQIGRAIYAVAVPSATLLAAPSIATAKSLPTDPDFSERPSDPPTKLLLPLRVGAYAPFQRGCERIDGNYADYDSILNFYGDDFSSSSAGYRIESTVSQGSAYSLRIHVEPTGGLGYVGKAKHIVWNVTLKDSTHFEIEDHDTDGDRTGQYVWCAKNTNVMMEENFQPPTGSQARRAK